MAFFNTRRDYNREYKKNKKFNDSFHKNSFAVSRKIKINNPAERKLKQSVANRL